MDKIRRNYASKVLARSTGKHITRYGPNERDRLRRKTRVCVQYGAVTILKRTETKAKELMRAFLQKMDCIDRLDNCMYHFWH